MGTNYYLHAEVCPHCAKPSKVLHIGKSSFGWSFSFRGHEHIRSYAQWLEHMRNKANQIVNEYGEPITVEEFQTLVNGKVDGLNHAKRYAGWDDWVDDEGHSFSGNEFS